MNEHYPFVNPPLPYDFNSLEPYIDTKTMELHHDRHLQTYVDQLNATLAPYPQYHFLSLEQLLLYGSSLPTEIQTKVKNNGGGVFNHIFFFDSLTPTGQSIAAYPSIGSRINEYGGYRKFKDDLSAAALSVFGSGYAWLVLDAFSKFKIITTPNQDTPLSQNLYPLLNVDVWEHAYYLKHYNQRAAYLNDWFSVINWKTVADRISSMNNY